MLGLQQNNTSGGTAFASAPRRVRWNKDKSVMVLVPEGEYRRGSTVDMVATLVDTLGADPRWFRDEQPSRTIFVSPFYIDIYPVTNRQYCRFCNVTGYRPPAHLQNRVFSMRYARSHIPVTGIEWNDAVAYCNWAGKRLPTEAEWEKAARGTDDRLFPWGDLFEDYRLNSGSRIGRPTAVGSFLDGASPYGVYDMAGNVYEWVIDWYDPGYYEDSPDKDPTGPRSGPSHVLRGGSWINVPTMVRSAERDYLRPPECDRKYLGFRTAADFATIIRGRYESL